MARARAQNRLNRRKFLAGMALAGTAAAAEPGVAATSAAPVTPRPSALRPTAAVAAAETGTPQASVQTAGVPSSDFMADVVKSLDIDYVPCNPAQSFRGLHESLINYGGNKKPEFLTCTQILGRDGARIFQDRREAAARALSRHGRSAARGDGDLQCLV